MKRLFCVIVAVLLGGSLLWSPPADAKDSPVILRSEEFRKLGLASFTFLKVVPNARVAAMGDAFAAVADDISAIYMNPGGLGHIDGLAYEFSYTKWLVDTGIYSGAVAYNTPRGILGLSVTSYDMGDMEVRTIFSPQGTGEQVKSGATVLGAAYAFKATDRLGVGIRVNYVQETMHLDTMSSVVFDVGTHFYTGFKSARIALAMRNFGPDTEVLTSEQKFLMPMYFDIGTAMEVYGEKGEPVSLTVAFESAFAVDYEQRWHLGGELWLANTLALRGGYKFNYDQEDFSLGAGLKGTFGDRKITLDVSYTNFGRLLNNPIRVSLGGSF